MAAGRGRDTFGFGQCIPREDRNGLSRMRTNAYIHSFGYGDARIPSATLVPVESRRSLL